MDLFPYDLLYGIEGYPFIIRFKTQNTLPFASTVYTFSIEGYPFIIRFKTVSFRASDNFFFSIEGYPFIIRFKTWNGLKGYGEKRSRECIEGYPFIIRFKT